MVPALLFRKITASVWCPLPVGRHADAVLRLLWQHRTIPALRLKHRSGSCGTASALPKCSIMSGCGTRIVLRGQKPLALCDRCPCFGSLFPPLAALTFAASSIICAFGLASAAPRSLYRHLELCGVAVDITRFHKYKKHVLFPPLSGGKSHALFYSIASVIFQVIFSAR